jgi:hypothetical protein
MLVQNGEAAAWVSHLSVYESGFLLQMVVLTREDKHWLTGVRFDPPIPDSPADLREFEEGFSLFVRFADGTTVSNVLARTSGGSQRELPKPSGPRLGVHWGQGVDGLSEYSYWISPLPPPGEFSIAIEWPAARLAEGSVSLSGDSVRAAALRSQVIFPSRAVGGQ